MNRYVYVPLVLLIATLTTPAVGQVRSPSLFFTQSERVAIDQHVLKNPPALSTGSKHKLHLDSILYIGPNHWTFWLQGEAWTPDKKSDILTVRAVSSREVLLSVKLANGRVADTITLHPNQTLNLLTGQISEGD